MPRNYTLEQFEELKKQFQNAIEAEEGYEYILLPAFFLQNKNVDILLCPQAREGYNSRLFFSEKLELKEEKPWTQFYIFDKNWFAYSWQPPTGISLIQMVGNHLKALKDER